MFLGAELVRVAAFPEPVGTLGTEPSPATAPPGLDFLICNGAEDTTSRKQHSMVGMQEMLLTWGDIGKQGERLSTLPALSAPQAAPRGQLRLAATAGPHVNAACFLTTELAGSSFPLACPASSLRASGGKGGSEHLKG